MENCSAQSLSPYYTINSKSLSERQYLELHFHSLQKQFACSHQHKSVDHWLIYFQVNCLSQNDIPVSYSAVAETAVSLCVFALGTTRALYCLV